MNTDVRFGVLTSPSVGWEQMVERRQAIEALGLAVTLQRNEALDAYCAEIGRNRLTLRRSLLL